MARLVHRSADLGGKSGSLAVIAGAGIEIRVRGGIAQIAVGGELDGVAARTAIARVIGVALPDEPNRRAGSDPNVLWLAPDKRLITSDSRGGRELRAELVTALADSFVAVTDMSDAYAVLEASGPRLRDILAMACALDFDLRAFPADRSARTLFANVPVLLYRHGGPDSMRLHVDRAVAHYLWAWLEEAAPAPSMAPAMRWPT